MYISDNKTSKIQIWHLQHYKSTNILLKKLIEIEAYLLVEVDVSERLAKMMKGFNTITQD